MGKQSWSCGLLAGCPFQVWQPQHQLGMELGTPWLRWRPSLARKVCCTGVQGYTSAIKDQFIKSLRQAAAHISETGRNPNLNAHPRMLPEALPEGPSCTHLLILVIAGLRVGLGSWGWWGCIGGRIVGAIAPIVVGRWWRRWRWWGCVALGVASLVVGWLAVTRLSRKRQTLHETDSTHWYAHRFLDGGKSVLKCKDGSGKQLTLG
jgi:hypothetical protein